ncbi:MAG: class I SAM-dependent methyltransferase [Methanomicrobium sp.]|nr:class I SAM-dependent methyltransferase [Methanomicrobium sp.]
MQQNDNIKNLTDCWLKAAGNTGFTDESKTAEFWNRRSAGYAENALKGEKQKRTEEILNFLQESGFNPKGARVLDIGCGPGTLSIPLAKAGAEITAVDISSGMLDKLKETVRNESLPVDIVECSWWTADIDKLGFRGKFDLVLASMTPAVKDLQSLERMIACSRGLCYYSNFLKRGEDKAFAEIFSLTGRENPAGHGNGMMYPFMYLYLQGCLPSLKINHSVWKDDSLWEEAAEKMTDFIGRSHECDEKTKEIIREYYKNASSDGRYYSESDVYTSMMVWKINGS